MSQIANRNLPHPILLGGLSVNLNHLNTHEEKIAELDEEMCVKIQELQQLIGTTGGLTKSSALMQNFVKDTHGKQKGRRDSSEFYPNREQYRTSVNSCKSRYYDRDSLVNFNQNASNPKPNRNGSEETIYKNAVQKRMSSSSEDDCIDISDESLYTFDPISAINTAMGSRRDRSYSRDRNNQATSRCSRSRSAEHGRPSNVEPSTSRHRPLSPDAFGDDQVRRSERAKASMLPPPGKEVFHVTEFNTTPAKDGNRSFQFIAEMDEDYLIVGNHVDLAMQEIIQNDEYVDFGKLIPQDRILSEDGDRMELVVRNGKTFWTQTNESVTIGNFNKWEQAFRIYSNIYTKKFPQKAGDLIQYNHVIYSISLTYVWENVYAYDKEFRIH